MIPIDESYMMLKYPERRGRFKKGNFVRIEKILPKTRSMKNLFVGFRIPPKRLINCTGKVVNIVASQYSRKILYVVHFIHEVDFKKGYVSGESFYFFEKELEKPNKNGVKRYKKWEDLLYAKDIAVKL